LAQHRRAAGPPASPASAAPCPVDDGPAPIRLDQFLKWQGLVFTGGEAKQRIQGGEVRVNGFQETRRGRKLRAGDRVELAGRTEVVPPEAAYGQPPRP
jgi:ribosome-associated protein